MAFFGSILRARRGDLHFLWIAALLALLIAPGTAHAAIAPQSAEAVLLWLQSERAIAPAIAPLAPSQQLLSIAHRKADSAPQDQQNPAETQLSAATSHCGQHLAPPAPENTPRFSLATAAPQLERHAVAHLSGVRTNRRLN